MTKDEALDLALEALEHMLEDAKQERLTVEYWNECVDAITAIKQVRSSPVQVSPLEFVTMVMEKEHLVGKPLFWAEWPNKENT